MRSRVQERPSPLLPRTIAGALQFDDIQAKVSEVGEGGEETEAARGQRRIPAFRKRIDSRPSVDGLRARRQEEQSEQKVDDYLLQVMPHI